MWASERERARGSFGNAPGECTSGAAPAAAPVATVEASTSGRRNQAPRHATAATVEVVD